MLMRYTVRKQTQVSINKTGLSSFRHGNTQRKTVNNLDMLIFFNILLFVLTKPHMTSYPVRSIAQAHTRHFLCCENIHRILLKVDE